MNILSTALLTVPACLQAWLGFLLWRRKVLDRFPWFFTYTVFSLIAGISKALVHGHKSHYFLVYWASEALYSVLGFLAIYEAFRAVFRSFYVLWWFKYLLPLVAGVALTIALIKALLFPPLQAPPVLATIFVAELAVRCVQAGVFALFVGLIWFNSMSARSYAFGIAFGFSISSLGILIAVLLRSEFGTQIAPAASLAPAMAYIIAEVIWLLFFVLPEPRDPFASANSTLTPMQVSYMLKQYRNQIKDWFTRCFQMYSS